MRLINNSILIKTWNHLFINQEDVILQWQQDEVNRRLQLIENGEIKTRSWNEAKKHVFKQVVLDLKKQVS